MGVPAHNYSDCGNSLLLERLIAAPPSQLHQRTINESKMLLFGFNERFHSLLSAQLILFLK